VGKRKERFVSYRFRRGFWAGWGERVFGQLGCYVTTEFQMSASDIDTIDREFRKEVDRMEGSRLTCAVGVYAAMRHGRGCSLQYENPVRIAKSMINEEARPLVDRCIKNARSLLDSAKELSEREDRLHISHHLTILALEEVGKAAIILIHSDALTDKLEWLDDHVKKIFWALWSFTLSRKSVSTAEIIKLKDAARGMHESRLQRGDLFSPIRR